MASHIYKCAKCDIYTLNKICASCNQETIMPKPPKFSPINKYAGYQRAVKIKELKEKGLY